MFLLTAFANVGFYTNRKRQPAANTFEHQPLTNIPERTIKQKVKMVGRKLKAVTKKIFKMPAVNIENQPSDSALPDKIPSNYAVASAEIDNTAHTAVLPKANQLNIQTSWPTMISYDSDGSFGSYNSYDSYDSGYSYDSDGSFDSYNSDNSDNNYAGSTMPVVGSKFSGKYTVNAQYFKEYLADSGLTHTDAIPVPANNGYGISNTGSAKNIFHVYNYEQALAIAYSFVLAA
ncbi:hypothetical protein H4S00_001996 [Coemansia sp. D1744]|nr:hypothetical protein H4S00_001996 [Coemansia sp. D1744]